MGYRYRFASVKKSFIDKVKDAKPEALIDYIKYATEDGYDEEENFISMYACFNQNEFFDFGDFDGCVEILKSGKPVFSNVKTQELFEENDLVLCDKETFLFAINLIRKQIYEYFKGLYDASDNERLHAIDRKISIWGKKEDLKEGEDRFLINSVPYNTDSVDNLVTSNLWEYNLFELVYHYKNFDWENNYLIFYGW